ncbi:MAG TPA: enoyl-CoA hydratase-related protein [Mycobacterium sp.]|nr:enoyl-CoA hydratase-related protein [Mycobacterium sp.]
MPVIAQVHGVCLAGGTQLAAICDITIVADDARVGTPQLMR